MAAENEALAVALEAGANDLRDSGEQWEVVTDPESLALARGALEEGGVPIATAELTMLPKTTVPLDGGKADAVLRLIDALEGLDDVQAVYSNFDIPDAILAETG